MNVSETVRRSIGKNQYIKGYKKVLDDKGNSSIFIEFSELGINTLQTLVNNVDGLVGESYDNLVKFHEELQQLGR